MMNQSQSFPRGPATDASKLHQVDICVYGGTSGAVAAAVEARQMGKRTLLLSPDAHLGGVTSGGLGFTDIGDDRILGGISREFFHQVYRHYSRDDAWNLEPRENFCNIGQRGPAINHDMETMSVFEPKVAEGIFEAWVRDNDIPVLRDRLDRGAGGVVMRGTRIASIRTVGGDVVEAEVFIDATHEGDLMATAGVSYATGREANAQYGETINGIQPALALDNQLPDGVDPYVRQGDPSSGLIPGVNPGAGGGTGDGDPRIQAYCYRMCLTDYAPNRVPIEKPSDYDDAEFELLFRAIAAGYTGPFFKTSAMPNYKTDSNNIGGVSTDYIGFNYDYVEGDYATRKAIARRHEQWQRGLLWTLQNHPRVPEAIRRAYRRWGLPGDEFVATGNWSHALYVREARRMISDHVITESLVVDSSRVKRSIAMGAYTMDSHNVQRYVTPEGVVRNEGDVQVALPGPYRIDYGAILPRRAECSNLLVTFCVSASHMAFGSIRMEPVFMNLSQSAAVAAAIAIDRELALQDVPYSLLEKKLLEIGQCLRLEDSDRQPNTPEPVAR